MKKLILLGLLTASMLVSCDKESFPDNPDPEPPVEPVDPVTLLRLSTTIELMSEVNSRAGVVHSFEPGHEIGLFYNDTCINKKLTYNGTAWSGGSVALAADLKNLYCYFPYQKDVKSHDAIPVDIDSQADYLAGSTSVGENSPNAQVKMKHILSLVRIVLKKNNYSGAGHVESLTWNGIYKKAKYNVITNTITLDREKGNYQAGGNYYVDDSKDPVVVETILMPINSAEGISITLKIDGEERVYELPEAHNWEAAKAYTYTLTLKGGYNSPIDLEAYPIDVTYWSTFGKTDNIVLSQSANDWFDIEPGSVKYGTDIYRNEGFMFGFYGYWTGYDMATGNMPEKWDGDFRMVLMDDRGNIVDKYQPCSIIAENGGMMKGTTRRSYVTAPVGSYELGVLFRKK